MAEDLQGANDQERLGEDINNVELGQLSDEQQLEYLTQLVSKRDAGAGLTNNEKNIIEIAEATASAVNEESKPSDVDGNIANVSAEIHKLEIGVQGYAKQLGVLSEGEPMWGQVNDILTANQHRLESLKGLRGRLLENKDSGTDVTSSESTNKSNVLEGVRSDPLRAKEAIDNNNQRITDINETLVDPGAANGGEGLTDEEGQKLEAERAKLEADNDWLGNVSVDNDAIPKNDTPEDGMPLDGVRINSERAKAQINDNNKRITDINETLVDPGAANGGEGLTDEDGQKLEAERAKLEADNDWLKAGLTSDGSGEKISESGSEASDEGPVEGYASETDSSSAGGG